MRKGLEPNYMNMNALQDAEKAVHYFEYTWWKPTNFFETNVIALGGSKGIRKKHQYDQKQ